MRTKLYLLVIVGALLSINASGQFYAYFDPAVAYNKMLSDKGQWGTYQNIGAFRVQGSPYIYSETITGDVYHNGQVAKDVLYKINNYSKQLQIATDVPGQYLMVSIDDLDSLFIPASKNEFLNSDLSFISSKSLDSKNKCFLELLQKGPRFTLYKSYNTELAIPSDNYVQSELREFQLVVVYYYTDSKLPGLLHQVRVNKKSLAKTFKENNAAEILDNVDLSGNTDLALTKFFSFLK